MTKTTSVAALRGRVTCIVFLPWILLHHQHQHHNLAEATVHQPISSIYLQQHNPLTTTRRSRYSNASTFGLKEPAIDKRRRTIPCTTALCVPRGGGSVADEVEEYEDESEEEEEEVEEEDGMVDEEDEEDEEEYDEEEKQVSADDDDEEEDETAFDEMLVQSPMSNMGVTLGVMILSRKLNLSDKKTIQYIRAAYLTSVIICQLFYAYVRFVARAEDDRTPVTISNRLTQLLQSLLKGTSGEDGSDNSNAKFLASRFLSSQKTVVEYDVAQSRSTSNGMLASLAFMWFLHFKLNQVQPLLFQTVSGLARLVYDPLFQVYALGKKLPRPFPSPALPTMGGGGVEGEENDLGGKEKNEMEDNEEEEADDGKDDIEDEEYDEEEEDESDED